jgi:molecular chaperone DnaJ
MSPQKDPYQVLGVNQSASPDEIKYAFRQLARQYHPDLNSDPGAAEKMREINEAYEVLSNPDKRTRYDRFGVADEQAQGSPFSGGFGGAGFGDLGDIFSAFFGNGSRQTADVERGPRRGSDLRAQVRVTLDEVATGTDCEISVNRHERCPTCSGTGSEPGTFPAMCSRCNGRGVLRQVNQSLFGQFVQEVACPDCRGEGQIIHNPCSSCRGTGTNRTSRKLNVKIPAGVEEATKLRLAGEGEAGYRGGSTGDLLIGVSVARHNHFQRNGAHLLTTLFVSYPTLVLGSTVPVRSVLEEHQLNIPPGTEPDKQFTLRGAGLPYLGRRERGDLYVTVKLQVPKKPSPEERTLVEQLAALERGESPISSSAKNSSTKPKKRNKGLLG